MKDLDVERTIADLAWVTDDTSVDSIENFTNFKLVEELITFDSVKQARVLRGIDSSRLVHVLALINDRYFADMLDKMHYELMGQVLTCLQTHQGAPRLRNILYLLSPDTLTKVLQGCNITLLRDLLHTIVSQPGLLSDKKLHVDAIVSHLSTDNLRLVLATISRKVLVPMMTLIGPDQLMRMMSTENKDVLINVLLPLTDESFQHLLSNIDCKQVIKVLVGRK